ncbi:hypothetical protein BJV78DRAFT_105888 [Lactifluus subvellereus]|nr:hypothetical protein BJV78DRAFT_105888 [Lactifluus subvellereus]
MRTLTTHPRCSYSAQPKRYQNVETKSLRKCVYISLCGFRKRMALPTTRNKRVLDSDLLREYGGIFINVKTWGAFESSDIELNGVWHAISAQTWSQRLKESWTASQVWPVMRVTRPNVYTIPDLGLHILGLARTQPPRTNLRRRINGRGAMPSDLRRCISHILCLRSGEDVGKGLSDMR